MNEQHTLSAHYLDGGANELSNELGILGTPVITTDNHTDLVGHLGWVIGHDVDIKDRLHCMVHQKRVTLQVLVNLVELTVDGAFKRMIHLAKTMLSDAIIAAEEGNVDLAKEVIQADDEVDRFGFYIIRQIEIAVCNKHMLKEIGFSNLRSCLGYRIVVKNIERTGDQAVIIASDLIEIKKSLKKSLHKDINAKMSDFAMGLIDDAMSCHVQR